MKVLIVLAHPERKSFNGAMVDTAVSYLADAGHEVQVSDLYSMGFDPVSDRRNFRTIKDPNYFKQQVEEVYATENSGFAGDIEAEYQKLVWADMLILQFPLWWFSVPAIMKGWIDRVFSMGRVYGGGKWYDRGLFGGKKAMLALTTGGGETMYAVDGLNGDINQILFPVNHGVLRFTGFDVLPPFIVWSPVRMDESKRQEELERYRAYLADVENLDPISYPALGDYDESFRLKSGATAKH